MVLREDISRIHFLINYDVKKSILIQEEENILNSKKFEGFLINESNGSSILKYFDSWDSHDWLAFGELSTGLLGMIPFPPFALAMNAISIGFGVSNAALYASEGDNYSASIALALALIPGPSTYKLGKEVFGKGGKEALQKILMKKAKGIPLTKVEQELLKRGMTQIGKNPKLFNSLVSSSLRQTIKTSLSKIGLEKTFRFLLNTANRPIFKNILFPIYGATVGVDSLYYLYTLTKKPEERRTLEEKRMLSDFKPLVDLLKNPTQIYNIISYQVNPKNIDENIDVSESIQVSEKTLQEGRNKLKAIQQRELGVTKPNQTTDLESPKTQTKITPTITTNEKTWINSISKGIWVLMKGSHTYNTKKGYEGVGDLIETIQEKLGIVPTGKFDQKTEDAVKNFQKENDLTVDGIIGPKTISKLNLIEI